MLLDVDPEKRTKPCHYDSCQPKSERFGHNETRPELNWVNSFPVTAVRFGIETFGPQCWGGYHPELVVAGPNVGRSAWLAVQYSGNAAVAAYAARAQIPAIAFSAASGSRLPWDTDPAPKASAVYAELARNLTNTVIASGKPYLPPDIFLNVNFPPVDERCPDAASFKWILTRMNPGIHEPRDLLWCNKDRLPTENYVRHGPGCYISVSPGDAYTKKTSEDVRKQEVILKKLQSILSCFP